MNIDRPPSRKRNPNRASKIGPATSAAYRSAETAQKLLDAASEVLLRRGSVEITLSEVAEVAGLNAALVNYHFGTKEKMLFELVKRDASDALGKLEELLTMDISPVNKMRFHVAGIVMTYAHRPYLNRLIHYIVDQGSDEAAKGVIDFFVAPLIVAERKILDEGVTLGVFRRVEPMHFYYAVIGACDHFFASRLSLRYIFEVEQITKGLRDSYAVSIVDFALRFLRPDATEPPASALDFPRP